MNEIALNVRPNNAVLLTPARRSTNRKGGAFYGYSSVIIALGIGWIIRDYELVNPENGVGYWLGIIGAVMMLVLLLYPVRKKTALFSRAGTVKHWFRIHVILGLLGPLIILYHCNFQLGSFNSQVALYTMLAVTISGVFGKHFYSRIHHGLFGRKATLSEFRNELANSLEKSHGLAAIMPNLITSLEYLSDEMQGDDFTQSIGFSRSLRWFFRKHFLRFKLNRIAHRELTTRAAASPVIGRDYKKLRRISRRYIRNYVRLLCRVAQFSFYERLFSLWHLLHLPLFFMLIMSALVHVLAVHMY